MSRWVKWYVQVMLALVAFWWLLENQLVPPGPGEPHARVGAIAALPGETTVELVLGVQASARRVLILSWLLTEVREFWKL